MPRKPKQPKPSEDLQPALFDPADFPTLPQLVEATKCYAHTGKTTCKDQERAEAIAQAYFETGQLLTVARRFHISPNTVKAVLDVLADLGKLDEVKQRVSRSLGLLAEVSCERAIEMVSSGTCPANVLPIMMGVALDKKALLDGEPTQRIVEVSAGPLGLQDVLSYLRAKGIKAPAIEVESTVSPAIAEVLEGQP